jgi:hypothetical protein
MSLRVAFRVACPLFLTAVACASDQEDPDADLGPLVASATIPVEGGAIELPDGARVEFPAGALSEESEVTLRRIGCGGVYQAASFGSCRYAVEGSAAVLANAYELHLPTRGPACATQQTVDGLVCMFGGEREQQAVTTLAGSFGDFTAWADDAVIPTDACVMPRFEACGGELLGSWSLISGCGTIEQLTNVSWSGPDPYESCDALDYYRGYPFSISGGLEFTSDGYQITSGFSIMEHELVTEACLASIGETCHPDCTLTDGICECLFVKSEGEGESGDDVWSLGEPGEVILGSATHPYCVDGDVLTVAWGAGEDRFYLVYARE